MSLIEMMIACVVLMVGVLSMAALIPLAIGTNSKNRQQSNSTVIAQMLMEKILSVPPGAPTTDALRLYGCVNDDHCTARDRRRGPAGHCYPAVTSTSPQPRAAPATRRAITCFYTACGQRRQAIHL